MNIHYFTSSKIKSYLLSVLRAALVIAPLVWIYSKTDAGAFRETLSAVSVPLVLAVAALTVTSIALQGVKWWILIRRFAPELKLARAVSVHMESTFYAIALPSGAAQDVVKSVILSKRHDPSVVWAASWLGRLIGLTALLICSVFGTLYISGDMLPDGFRVSLVTAVAAIVLLIAVSFSKRVTRPLRGLTTKIIPNKILPKLENLREGIYAFRREYGTLAQTFIISLAIQFLIIFTVSLTVYTVSGKFYFYECLAFVTLVELLVISVPLTPGGVGVREGLMTIFFSHLGFTGEQIASYVTISLLMVTTRAVGLLPVVFRMGRR